MNRYSIYYDSVTGDSHSIEFEHEDEMTEEELKEKLIEITKTLNSDSKADIGWCNSKEFKMFSNELPKHEFQKVSDYITASVHIHDIAYELKNK